VHVEDIVYGYKEMETGCELMQEQSQTHASKEQVAEMKEQMLSGAHLHGFGSGIFADVGGAMGAA
jgi:hypothetical protein